MENSKFVLDLAVLEAFFNTEHPEHEFVVSFFNWLLDNGKKSCVSENTWEKIKENLRPQSETFLLLKNVVYPDSISTPIEEPFNDKEDAVLLTYSSCIGSDVDAYLISPDEYEEKFIQTTLAKDQFDLSGKINSIKPSKLMKILPRKRF